MKPKVIAIALTAMLFTSCSFYHGVMADIEMMRCGPREEDGRREGQGAS